MGGGSLISGSADTEKVRASRDWLGHRPTNIFKESTAFVLPSKLIKKLEGSHEVHT